LTAGAREPSRLSACLSACLSVCTWTHWSLGGAYNVSVIFHSEVNKFSGNHYHFRLL